MNTLKSMGIFMPCFFQAKTIIINVRSVTTNKITLSILLFSFMITRRFPILRIPIVLTKPFIKYFIFKWVKFFSSMLYSWVDLCFTMSISFTFFNVVVSSCFSLTRICAIFWGCTLTRCKKSFTSFNFNLYFT